MPIYHRLPPMKDRIESAFPIQVIKFDMNGLGDSKSITNAIEQLAPSNVIFINTKEATHSHIEKTLENLEGLKIRLSAATSPSNVITIHSASKALKVRVQEEDIKKITLKKMDESFEFAQIRGKIQFVLGTESNIQETKLVISENPSRINFDEMDNKILADFSLVKFKAFLEQYQIQVDLLSGGLKHKDIVMIRLTNDNKVVLEGFYCKEYYQIRHLLYEYTMALKV
eukprot:TRINITY_DN10434_c0_g1_i1.p1 TRINITY_DN10434_c0_g1~~TRINITY_DN10434_c0_g1_i1.p1  ORF type:complete len:227 (+),score=48.60 TRINITY_DN10434_c0_g1_i1:157-837(+)